MCAYRRTPSASLRTTRHNLQCVLRFSTPYTTCTPAASSRVAHRMLLRSSNRALSSTSTATCLPLSAASISRSTSGESLSMRYSVILIATTCGSATACCRTFRPQANESNGMVHEPVLLTDVVEDRRVVDATRPTGSSARTARPSATDAGGGTAPSSPKTPDGRCSA